jgi:3-methyladenine DNA glycosylase/8-oxoguanine DNA glycosylase
MRTRAIPLTEPLNLRLTLAPLWRGRGDPTMRMAADGVWRTTRTPEGPATIRFAIDGGALRLNTWGPGADWAIEAGPAMAGLDDDPSALRTDHPLVRALTRKHRGLRLPRTMAVVETLIPAITEQKVTGREAHRSFQRLVERYGEPAPGPAGEAGMRVSPDPAVLARLPYYAFHQFGLEQRRAEAIRRVAAEANRLEAASSLASPEREARLRAVPGVGAWTVAEVATRAWGDPDAVSVGDFHLPSVVAWAFLGVRRGTDEQMLALLEPFRGQRGRVVRLLEVSGIGPPRRGPRYGGRSIEAI